MRASNPMLSNYMQEYINTVFFKQSGSQRLGLKLPKHCMVKISERRWSGKSDMPIQLGFSWSTQIWIDSSF